jgi:cell division protein FtsL
MTIYIQDMPWYKKLLYIISSYGLYPTILSTIGFSYIALPSTLQETVRHYVPISIRKELLSFFTTDEWLIVLLVSTVLFAIWGAIGSQLIVKLTDYKNKLLLLENEQLKMDKDSKNIDSYNLFSKYLYSYFQRFELTTEERISLYKLEMEVFSCIGRYSENETFRTKPNRLYPSNQGCISKVWEIGLYENANIPDPLNIDEWNQYNIENYSFTVEELNKIRMKSRSYFGLRLKNAEHVTIAVIIFESLSPSGLPFGKLKRFFKESEIANLTNLIESLNSHIPSLTEANQEGY